MKISELQSQIALNRQIISEKEAYKKEEKENIKIYSNLLKRYPEQKYTTWKLDLADAKYHYKMFKRQIAQYAKLQRALKEEIAYKIKYTRIIKQIREDVEKAKTEGWEVVVEDESSLEDENDQTN